MRRMSRSAGEGAAARASARKTSKATDTTTSTDRSDDQRSVVNSLAKGLRVLEAFTAERMEMSLSEVAAAAGLDPGTTFRMLNTLVMLGYVSRSATKRFRLTLKAADLGLHAIGRADLRELARPVLRSLVGEVSEAASLGVLDGGDIVYVERVRAGLTRIGVDIRIGTTIPVFCSTIGQALLAYLPPQEAQRVLGMTPRAGSMPTVPVEPARLDKTLAKIRRDGHALYDSYFGSGLRVLAVPVLDLDGYPVAALSVVAPTMRLGMDEFRARALDPVRAAAADIARAVQAGGAVMASV